MSTLTKDDEMTKKPNKGLDLLAVAMRQAFADTAESSEQNAPGGTGSQTSKPKAYLSLCKPSAKVGALDGT